MLNRVKRRYLRSKCKHEMAMLVDSVDNLAVETAKNKGLTDDEAREFIVMSVIEDKRYMPVMITYLKNTGWVNPDKYDWERA